MKNKKNIKILICVLLSVALLSSIMLNTSSVGAVNKSPKIEDYLLEQLEGMSEYDTIKVSIWLTDTEESEKNERIHSAINEKVLNGELPSEILSLLPNFSFDINKELFLDESSEIEKNISIEQAQLMISVKRQISAALYNENNTDKVEQLFSEEEISQSLVFQSHYSPNVVMNLCKEKIYEISNNELVDFVYIYNDNIQIEDEDNTFEDDEDDEIYSHDISTYQFEMTGIDALRDDYGFTGDGIKVGIFDKHFSKLSLVDYIADDTIQGYNLSDEDFANDYYTHGSNVAYLIAGNYTDENTNETFFGAAPDSELYLTATEFIPAEYRECLEQLLDFGVNIISSSLKIGNDGFNNYGDVALWIDHITSQHNVLFVSSAGNSGSSGITSGKFGYNLLAVGACDSNGELTSFSSYSMIDNDIYKPDLVAPGKNIITPSTRTLNSHFQGTSWAAPIVAGAAAQLCESSVLFLTYPHLLKSAILAGTSLNTYILNEYDMIKTSVNDTDNELCRKYGAGILNAENSYESSVLNNYTAQGYIPYFVNNVSFSKQVNVSEGDIIRVCASWDKKALVNGNHTTSGAYSPGLENYMLDVRTPSGASYRALYYYDNKEMVSFVAQESGIYNVTLVSMSNNYNQFTSFGIALSTQTSPL